ncbi:UNVERIFIED_CONTAM: hypothetical protein Sradi_3585900 [Sesamum radiatum]|uniref:RNase H type-1 domain-containing protein n=1 Tax=Sesamum radiatum TaxID=300843 RepID=A0AAW2QGN6_SESRA
MVLEFVDGLDVQTNTYTELYAIVKGFQLAKDAGCTQLWIESDDKAVLEIISKDSGDWRLQHLLTHLKIMRQGMNVIFSHIHREGNQPANFLTKKLVVIT